MAEHPGSKGGAGGGGPASLADIYDRYQNKLLSITGKNRSVLLRRIYIKHSCDLAALERVAHGAATRVAPKAIRDASPSGRARASHTILHSSARGDDADRFRGRLKTLARNLGRIEEETGQQAGYLGFPFLVGHAAPNLYVRGPVALFPVSLEPGQGARTGGWSVQFQGRAPIINSSLFMSLKKRARHPVPDGYEERFGALLEEMQDVEDAHEGRFLDKIGDWLQEFLPLDSAAGEPRSVEVAPLDGAAPASMPREPLRLVNHKVVGSFPVADSKIYDDYAELIRRADEPSHGLIAGLLDLSRGGQEPSEAESATPAGVDGPPASRPGSAARPADIDGAPSATLNTVLPSDSSQDAVILESQKSDIVVVRGPPGTGKSQVIVNLVSDALVRGEKVLVVCQKRAALEVVRQRLDKAGLGRYSVFLEREADDKLLMYRRLCDIIEDEPAGNDGDVDITAVDRGIDTHVGYLRDLGAALHAKLGGATAYDLYSRADASHEAMLDLNGVEGLPDWGGLEEYLGRMGGIEGDVKRFDDPAGPWHGRKSFSALTNRDKGKIRDAVHRIRGSAASSVLLGSSEDQSRLAAALRACASGETSGPSPSAEIEAAIRIGAGEGADAALCAKMAGDMGRAHGAGESGCNEAGDALAELVEQYTVREEAATLRRAAGDSILVGGRGEQEAFASALESYALRMKGRLPPPSPGEIERAVRIGAGADDATAFCAKMAGDMALASGRGGKASAGHASAPDTAAALSEFAALCGLHFLARELSGHAHDLLAGGPRDQEALVSALESYVGDKSIMKGQKKRAIKEIAGMGLEPEFVVGGSGGKNAGRSLERAREGLGFWRLLPAPVSGNPDRFCEVRRAAEQRSEVGPALSEAMRSIEKDMGSNRLSRWAKSMILAGAESARDAPKRDDAEIAVQSYMDDPSPMRASAGGADARQQGHAPGDAGGLHRAVRAALAEKEDGADGAAGSAPEMPNSARYWDAARTALLNFVNLHYMSGLVKRLAALAPSCALARTAAGQARLPGLYEAARKGGMLAGKERRRAMAEIRDVASVGPPNPDRAVEQSKRGAKFWAEWPEAVSIARELGVAGSEGALDSREALASHLEALARALDKAMEKSPLAEWSKRLHRAGAEAAMAQAGFSGRAAPDAAAEHASLSRELCGELAIVNLGMDEPAATATAEVNRYAAALATDLVDPVRRGVKFWSDYSDLRSKIGPAAPPGGWPTGPQEALEEILRARDASARRVEQSPVSEWAKMLATSRSLRGVDDGDDGKQRRADAEMVARLYMDDPCLLDAERRANAGAGRPPKEAPAASMVRSLFAELGRRGAPPELPPLPDGGTAALYESMIANALSAPQVGRPALAKWVRMIMECAPPGPPGGAPPDPHSIPPERALSPGFLELDKDDPLCRMADDMRRAAEKTAADSIPAVEEGQRVWDAFEGIRGFFGPDARAGGPAGGPADPEAIESFAAAAAPHIEADALDGIQELDKKRLVYEPSIFALLEMARERIGRDGDWTAAIRREIYAHWIDRIERAHPVLTGRPLDNYNEHAGALADLSKEKRGLVVSEIRRRIESARPGAARGASRAMPASGAQRAWRAMLGELKKKRRVMPVRRLIENYSDQLFKIAPCWLASPESISKTLPLKRGLFDLAIVDEASQLAMERTLPFLYRAKRAVIAGDERQLQPFDLFQARADGEEGGEEEGCEADRQYDEKSLLDLARVKHEEMNLAWHYRSRHQALIDFSNHAFYGGLLNVVPDVRYDPARPPIRWIECGGTWNERANEEEAAEAVAQVRGAWADADASGRDPPTVGVITFNETQQNLILDKIEAAKESDAEFGRLYGLAHRSGKRDAALFVKNIENVQGDERDVIIFSVGYARDMEGRFSNKFGSLNARGGENRLNVAVTRARESMVVISSIDPSMISASSANDGPRRFRQFLEYARYVSAMDVDGRRSILASLCDAQGAPDAGGSAVTARGTRAEDALGKRIRDALEGAGYKVRAGLGFSGYRIDLAVVDPRDENRYAVAIEYDGPTFRSARSVMERDVMRPGLLRSRGWAFERTWSRSWWKDSGAELSRLRARITEAMMR